MANEGIVELGAKMDAVLAQLGVERYQSPRYTVADAIELLRGSLTKRPLAAKTRRMYLCWLDHGARVLGDVELRHLSRSHCRQLLDALADRPATARQSCFVVSAAIENAMEAGMTQHNPFPGLKKPMPNRRTRILSKDLCARLEADIRDNEAFGVYAAVRWQMDTGWRCGEVLGIDRADVNLDHLVIRLRQTKTGPRDAKISRALADWAREWMHSAGPVFREDGARVTYRRVSAALKRASERLGVECMTTHVFRHTFISRMISEGVRRKVVARMVGHDDVRSTDRYTHVTDAEVEAALEAMSRKRTERPDE